MNQTNFFDESLEFSPYPENEIVLAENNEEENGLDPKSVPTFQEPDRQNKIFRCRICLKLFSSRYLFELHVNTHTPFCEKCHITFKSWHEVTKHKENGYCSRNTPRILIEPRPLRRLSYKKKKTIRHKCHFCLKNFTQLEMCIEHKKRCSKRVICSGWVLKM